ncbi:hypothetical protein [Variovorax sp. GT1P44]|uniref:hypothetical protein n=1 Tax=Variovorax sp. GT1P44 TaxID=3443742 RepID=UPI003F48EA80
MNRFIIGALPAAVALAFAYLGPSALAQGTAPKTENAGEKAWDATKSGAEKAMKATEKGAKATGKAIDNVADDAASGTRKVGDKIGEKIPGTVQNEAVKK